jgi:hypothetical protein
MLSVKFAPLTKSHKRRDRIRASGGGCVLQNTGWLRRRPRSNGRMALRGLIRSRDERQSAMKLSLLFLAARTGLRSHCSNVHFYRFPRQGLLQPACQMGIPEVLNGYSFFPWFGLTPYSASHLGPKSQTRRKARLHLYPYFDSDALCWQHCLEDGSRSPVEEEAS